MIEETKLIEHLRKVLASHLKYHGYFDGGSAEELAQYDLDTYDLQQIERKVAGVTSGTT